MCTVCTCQLWNRKEIIIECAIALKNAQKLRISTLMATVQGHCEGSGTLWRCTVKGALWRCTVKGAYGGVQ